jgi:hypothetical protein
VTDKNVLASPPEEVDEVEASRAPLLDHLIELRQRLVRAIIAVFVAFIVCFFFAKQIYNAAHSLRLGGERARRCPAPDCTA